MGSNQENRKKKEMKNKHGFVSNSSSSSFIVAIKRANVACPHCGRKDIDFLDQLEKTNAYVDDNGVDVVGKEGVLHRYKNYHDEELIKEIEQKMKKYNDKKWQIASIRISYHDQIMRQLKDNIVNSGNMEIIYGDE